MQSVSLIITVLNEAATITALLQAIAQQTHPPDEFIIVDGGSSDQTVELIKKFVQKLGKVKQQKNSQQHQGLQATNPRWQIKTKPGNRSVGRNYAIQLAKHPLIAITDAGCIPEPDWLEQLLRAYQAYQSRQLQQAGQPRATSPPVIAGYYRGLARTPFQEAVIPYVLVMPDRVNPATFLPATRSILLPKKVWQKLGGFDEKLNYNEDYAFARKIQAAGQKSIPIIFTQKAIVNWLPRQNLAAFITMIYKFAKGDIQAGILRPKVVLIFLRYLLATLTLPAIVLLLYSLWAIAKNKKYTPKGWYYLPLLQISSDLAVMAGSLAAITNLARRGKPRQP